MNLLRLSLLNLKFRALVTFFNIMVLALGIATIVALLHVSEQMNQRFSRDLEGIDLVVGAKGSPIQLILSSVFHLDAPVGNIALADAEKLERNPLIKSAIPLSLGDNYHGFRIVGTEPSYAAHYNAPMGMGAFWTGSMQAVLGSEVATATGLKPGDTFAGAHGLSEGGEEHAQTPYKVVGVLAPTGTVIDRLILTDLESVWNVHEHHEDEHSHAEHPAGREITALLITYKSDYAAMKLPYLVNKSPGMQAASPATEMSRLMHIAGIGGETVRFFGEALMFIAALGFFVNLWGAVADRRYDIALMRTLGATRSRIFGFVLAEGITLGLLGLLVGLALGHVLAYAAQRTIETSRHMSLAPMGFHPYELHVALVAIVLSILAALLPALLAYRVNVAAALSKGS